MEVRHNASALSQLPTFSATSMQCGWKVKYEIEIK